MTNSNRHSPLSRASLLILLMGQAACRENAPSIDSPSLALPTIPGSKKSADRRSITASATATVTPSLVRPLRICARALGSAPLVRRPGRWWHAHAHTRTPSTSDSVKTMHSYSILAVPCFDNGLDDNREANHASPV